MDELRQPTISSSAYQKQLDEEVEEDPDIRARAAPRDGTLETPVLHRKDIRYWSDFSRVYYLPRSLHQLPDVLDFENSDEDWSEGKTMFERYDAVSLFHFRGLIGLIWNTLQDHTLVDDSFRLFVEECDAFQVGS